MTKLEYALLRELVLKVDKVIGYEQLLEKVWGAGYKDAMDSLHHCAKSLRGKIEPDPKQPRYIVNIPRIGYRYHPHADSFPPSSFGILLI